MANILFIEINALLNYSRINYIFLKQELFMTQLNVFSSYEIWFSLQACFIQLAGAVEYTNCISAEE